MFQCFFTVSVKYIALIIFIFPTEVICPSGWVFHRKCYHISYTARNWTEARKACQAMGADLVTIESKDEQVRLKKINIYTFIETFYVST